VQNVDNKTLARAQLLSFDIEERIRQLEVLIRWRDELRAKISGQWIQGDDAPHFEATAPDIEELQEEVAQFVLACKGARI
jgi:hypothetical protein